MSISLRSLPMLLRLFAAGGLLSNISGATGACKVVIGYTNFGFLPTNGTDMAIKTKYAPTVEFVAVQAFSFLDTPLVASSVLSLAQVDPAKSLSLRHADRWNRVRSKS